MDLYEEIVALRRRGRRGALATVVSLRGSVPSFATAKMLVREDGSIAGTIGGGRVESDVCSAAREVMEQEKPRMLSFDLNQNPGDEPGLICGGAVEVFLEPIVPMPRLYIFGAGHVALQLSKVAHLAGFDITVIDERPEFASRERYPEARKILSEDLDLVTEKLEITDATYIVIVTRGHAEDTRVLSWAAGTSARYIGMIGSKRKVSTVYRELQKQGVSPERLAQVHAPVGLNIGAVTPEEIAVSIAAELIAVRRNANSELPSKSAMLAAEDPVAEKVRP